jgi:hypothetical protein
MNCVPSSILAGAPMPHRLHIPAQPGTCGSEGGHRDRYGPMPTQRHRMTRAGPRLCPWRTTGAIEEVPLFLDLWEEDGQFSQAGARFKMAPTAQAVHSGKTERRT